MLGEKIRSIRELKGLSQEYMAEALGISVSAYGKLERNQTELHFSRLEKIIEVLEIPLEKLLSFDEKCFFLSNNSNDSSTLNTSNIQGVVYQSNEKEIELYERLLREKDEMYAKLLAEKDKVISMQAETIMLLKSMLE